jgi:peptide/nickel transport system permease protein
MNTQTQAAPAPVAVFLTQLLRFIRTQPLGSISFVIIAAMGIAAIFAEQISPYDPVAIDFLATMAPPSAEHPFGTDAFGRDILTRIIYGARTALSIGFFSAFIGASIGAVIGMASAYMGGRVDLLIQRVIDVLLSFPIIVLALVTVTVLGRNPVAGIDLNLICAIALPVIPRVARVIRSAALSVRQMSYIDAARAGGYSNGYIIMRHMAPNIAAPYLVLLTAYIAQAILLEASLSFLGLGVAEPQAAWGLMLAGETSSLYRQAPWAVIFPGVAISLAVFAFNLLGDSLRDWLDPRIKT